MMSLQSERSGIKKHVKTKASHSEDMPLWMRGLHALYPIVAQMFLMSIEFKGFSQNTMFISARYNDCFLIGAARGRDKKGYNIPFAKCSISFLAAISAFCKEETLKNAPTNKGSLVSRLLVLLLAGIFLLSGSLIIASAQEGASVVGDTKIYLPLVMQGSAPDGFTKIGPGDGSIDMPILVNLTWNATNLIDTYSYCLDTDAAAGCQSGWVNVGSTSYAEVSAEVSLIPNTTYYWEVRAYNGFYTDADSGTWWTFRTEPMETSLMSEDFEGSLPGGWELTSYLNGTTLTNDYKWGKRNCNPFAGSYSGWAVGGGTLGSGLGCGDYYPNNVETWMVYGPFSLSDANTAYVSYELWLNSENASTKYDQFCALASLDGTNFDGNCYAGNSQGWVQNFLNLDDVGSLGNLAQHPQVWIAFYFGSDGSTTYPGGAFVDNIQLEKCTANICAELPTSVNSKTSATKIETLKKTPVKMIHHK